MAVVDVAFRCMGCDARVALQGDADAAVLEAGVQRARATLEDVETRLSRFVADSELSRLNRDPRPAVPASPVLCRLAEAASWAAQISTGLVDAGLAVELERAGYASDWDPGRALELDEALRLAPARRPAGPRAGSPLDAVRVLDGVIHRPAGLALDAGGLGKGLAADLALAELPAASRALVSLGGDLAVRGPWEVVVERVGGGEAHRLALRDAAAATSGIHVRLWRTPEGGAAHHVLDPATGRPAWTGLVAATALGPTALYAEVFAKTALLAGPRGAARVLRRRGGVLQDEAGAVTVVEPAPVVRLRLSGRDA